MTVDREIDSNFQKAKVLQGWGRLLEAETIFRSVLLEHPRHFDALYMLGVLKLQQRNATEACQLLGQAAALRPDSTEALSTLGFALMMLDQHVAALTACDRALALDRKHIGAWITRANALAAARRFDEALSSLDEALKIDADNSEALIARGTLLATLEQPDKAVETFDRLPVQNNPANLFKRARLLESLGLAEPASRDFRQLTALLPEEIAGWVGLLTCAGESCDWPQLAEAQNRSEEHTSELQSRFG